MDKKAVAKYGMMALGMVLTAASQFVNSKNQDATMKETIVKEVEKHFTNQTKES